MTRTAADLRAYFAGELRDFDVPLAPSGSPFQLAVWSALTRIPYGTTTSYGAIARQLGKPLAMSRAVGAANGQNPIAVIIPCHRVIGADRGLTGYGGGLAQGTAAPAGGRSRHGRPGCHPLVSRSGHGGHGGPLSLGVVTLMDAESWFASLPTMYGSAAALITDTDGPSARVLLVKPNYRAGWSLPGGILEEGEPPHVGCFREVEEELGLAR